MRRCPVHPTIDMVPVPGYRNSHWQCPRCQGADARAETSTTDARGGGHV